MTNRKRILVVEDEYAMRQFILANLPVEEFETYEADNAKQAIRIAANENPDVILLDLGLPDRDGIDLARTIREWSQVPIIVLSSREEVEDKVAALDAGADDYLTKPFNVNEFHARMRVALRRSSVAPSQLPASLDAFGVHINFDLAKVYKNGKPVKLTRIEYKLLSLLAREPDRVMTHRQLLLQTWGEEHACDNHYLRVYMGQLRNKLEDDPAQPKLVVSEYGIGYRLQTEH